MSNFEAMTKAAKPARPPRPEDFTDDDAPRKIDGRSARRTSRTVQFATVVSPGFKSWLKIEAAKLGKSQAALLDDMKAAYIELCERRR